MAGIYTSQNVPTLCSRLHIVQQRTKIFTYVFPTFSPLLMPNIDTVIARSKLKARNEPYWQRMAIGCYLGYRKLTPSSTGTWIAGYRDSDTGIRTKKSLGDFSELAASERHSAAKQAAESWFTHLGRGGSPEVLTVGEVCNRWIEHKRNTKGAQATKDAQARFDRWVYPNKIAKVAVNKLTRNHIDVWRAGMAKTLVVINPYAKFQKTRERSAATINRDMSELRAALNFAHDNNWVTDDSAWRQSLKQIKNADKRRKVYLDKSQRKALVEAVEPDFGAFLTGLSLIPFRPGALAALKVSDFDSRLQTLLVSKDKHGQDRRIKLPPNTAAFIKSLVKDKAETDTIFTRSDGMSWDRHTWKKRFKPTAQRLGHSDEVSVYAIRHSGITDLVIGGLDLLTVALISGTSVAMIEKHYGHLRQDHAAKALEGLSL
jgi:site-specific recombinase XerD